MPVARVQDHGYCKVKMPTLNGAMPAPAALPPGERVYAVGDVHGCLEQLTAMHAAIAADLAARPTAAATLVHLGDYIDRGPDSAGVLATLLSPPASLGGMRIVNLIGNHEDMLLAALDGRRGEAGLWLENGGVASLQSWAVPPRLGPRDWARLIPAAQIDWLRGLPTHHVQGGYVFVHAGLRPGVDLAAQRREDMLWIRAPFLSFDGALPGVVVHGHTPERATPVIRRNRIGIDTGAVLGGPLTCAVLDNEQLAFIAV